METPLSKPHILFLLSDQHSPRIAGCYGDPYVKTPNIDRLARDGVAFDGCYCDNPLCVPSRMSLLTARHGHQIQVWGNTDSLNSTIPTIAHGMGIAGYRTVLAGRMHFVGADQWHGFQERVIGDVTNSAVGTNRAEHRFRGFWGNDALENPGVGRSYDLTYDTAVAMEACRVIRDHEVSGDKRPLFLVASFYSPHDPYVMPRERLEPYLDCGDDAIDADAGAVNSFCRVRAEKNRAIVTPERRRLARAAYRAKTQFLDGLLGEILDSWRESPLAGDAMCVYTSDHGEMLGEHGQWTKGCFYESAARVPLIINAPGRVKGARRIANPVSLIDLTPTLLDAAGAPPLPHAAGQSFWPALTGGSDAWPGEVFSEQSAIGNGGPCRMIRRGPWKYIHYESHPPELYHLADDPDELKNLADASAHQQLRKELHERLFSDGWDPQCVVRQEKVRKPDLDYLHCYARVVEPIDPWQWGRAAQL